MHISLAQIFVINSFVFAWAFSLFIDIKCLNACLLIRMMIRNNSRMLWPVYQRTRVSINLIIS